jgi:primosomal protein N' (replication factor Y)
MQVERLTETSLPLPPADSGEPQKARLYAEVAVESQGTLLSGLTYSVPRELEEFIQPGQLVWVPLRKRQAQGIVLSLGEQQPDFPTRNLLEIVDQRPLLATYQLELARWLSEYYCAGLYECAILMLPAGFTRYAKPTLILANEAREGLLPAGLNQNEYFLVELLRQMIGERTAEPEEEEETGEVLLSDAQKAYNAKRAKSGFEKAVKCLEEYKLVKRGFFLPRPGVKPQIKLFARLSPLISLQDESLLKKLARAKKQKTVLEYINASAEPDYLLPADEICEATGVQPAFLRAMAEKGLLEVEEREVRRDPLANRPQRERAEEPPILTYQQAQVWRELLDGLQTPGYKTYLLHGVTGSGKTELYLRAIARTLRDGKQAIVLVPEIALTAQTVDRFAARFPGKVAVRHSKLYPGEAYDEWRRTREGEAQIVIGARSAVFAPLVNPGLIIIDEEHEGSYKQDDSEGRLGMPLYNAREVACEIGRLTGAKVILGSATPSIESYFRTQMGEFKLLELPERVAAPHAATETSLDKTVGTLPLPPVQIVDLRQELKSGNTSIFSRVLRQQLKQTLEREQQAILFLNRRGTATVVMCRDCGYIEQCPNCETPLVWHGDLEILICHRCGQHAPHPIRCANCNSQRIRYFGTGTKRVEEEVLKLFPEARVLRWDQDTIGEGGRDSYQTLYDNMANHEADILVGTQMIAKGLDLPLVSLVGVVTSDTGLYLPDFRATERTFQILTQVAGRAGRRTNSKGVARAILQTYTPDQYAIQAASRHDYISFYRQDLEFRAQRLYPPFCKLIKFVYAYPKEERAQLEIGRVASDLKFQFNELDIPPESWSMVGPAPSFQRKYKGLYRYQFVLRIHRPESFPPDEAELAMRHVIMRLRPQLVHGWTLDVDPQNML